MTEISLESIPLWLYILSALPKIMPMDRSAEIDLRRYILH